MKILSSIVDFLFPMCPNGGHRIKVGMVTNVNGNHFCWHKDCVRANFKDIEAK